jgi:Asp-tRNA(Asn)/Glu-tRNA(Gln) amidotransferase A subunit family amidase
MPETTRRDVTEPPETELWRLSAHSLRDGLCDGKWTIAAVVESCLARIAAQEPELRAWAWHDPELVRRQAAALDKPCAAERPLLGIPIGIKDIIDTCDIPTAYGAALYAGHRPSRDAEAVARLRAAGGIIAGKTVTTEFAYATPGPTVNPHNHAHTPGGSSSGSAAAVAVGMVPLALGSQTGGSTIRPSAYCGIVGFKPTHGTIPTAGMKALAPSMDTVGILARTVDDVAMILPVLTDDLSPDDMSPSIGAGRIACFAGPHLDQADPDAQHSLEAARQILSDAGVSIELPSVPMVHVAALADAWRVVMAYEAAMSLAGEYQRRRASLSAATVRLIEEGRAISARPYLDALALAAACRADLAEALLGFDALMTFSAPGEAPRGTASTGNSIFNRGWSIMGVPCLTLPFGRGSVAGLPLGVQLVAPFGQDARLLMLGGAVERLFEPFNRAAQDGVGAR